MNTILLTVISLSAIAAVAAVILYFVAQKFKVFEDPRIDEVEESLPSANCGGCGFPGCRAFAEACVKADDLGGLYCPPGGNDTMSAVADILGMSVEAQDPQVAVLLCNGTPEYRKDKNHYDGASNCTIASNLYGGTTDCSYGCVGLGECVDACDFDAMYMDEDTGLPVVIESKCTACGGCVDACPKNLFELRKQGKKSRRIFVSCMNMDKGAPAKKSCDVACIGCSKCFKECAYEAIEMKDNKAYIFSDKCVLCRKCVAVCPTGSIHELNFPARKVKPKAEGDDKPKAKPAPVKEKAPVKETVEKKEAEKEVVAEKKVENTDNNDNITKE